MKIFTSALAVFLFLSSSPAHSSDQFNREQSRAIESAERFGLPVLTMKVEIDGIERSILILGETHVKPAEVADQEMALLSHFDFRLIEGYSDSGRPPTFKEKALMRFIDFIYPVMQKTKKEGRPSTLGRTYETGFYRHNNGWIYFDRCYIGRTKGDQFLVHKPNYDLIMSRLAIGDRSDFRAEFSELGYNARAVRKATQADSLINNSSGTGCPGFSGRNGFTSVTTHAIEIGDLAKWNRNLICGDLVCTYGQHRKPSSRELRMAENIYLNFKAFPDRRTGLVLVGSNHLPGLKYLLEDWPTRQVRHLIAQRTAHK